MSFPTSAFSDFEFTPEVLAEAKRRLREHVLQMKREADTRDAARASRPHYGLPDIDRVGIWYK